MPSRPLLAALTIAALATLVASPVTAAPGGRIELRDDAIRTVDTRTGVGAGKVTTTQVGSGVLQVWVLTPDDVGTAVVHPCSEPAPTDRSTFRLDPADVAQYARVFVSETSCITSSTPVHVLVDDGGTVTSTSELAADQFVALATPRPLSTTVVAPNTTLVLPRPAELTADATAAIVTIEALLSVDPGFATAYGCDGSRPFLPDLSFSRGLTANVADVPIGPSEDICIYASAEVTIRTTLIGELRSEGPTPEALPPTWNYVPGPVPAPSLRAINPVRLLDTRNATVPPGSTDLGGVRRLRADETFELAFADLVGPSTTAVSMNVTAANAVDGGFLTVWPCDGERPEASNLNFTTTGAVPNLVVTPLSPDRTVCLSPSSDVHVIVDVNGTYERDGGLHAVPVEPVRILDTRAALGTPIAGRVAAGNAIALQVTGGDVASDAGAATLNVTAAESDEDGFVTVYPCDQARPTASNLNFRAGQAVPNLVTTPLSSAGTVCLFTSQTVHLIADLAVWYGLERPAGLVDLAPTRVLDTRGPIGVDVAGRALPSQVIRLDFELAPAVAADADAVVMNITAAQSAGIGFVTAWPCDQIRPTVSNLNIRPERTVANLAVVKLSADGGVCLSTTSSTHLIADVAGYLTDEPVDGDRLVLVP